MEFELEQEMYIDPQIKEMREKKKAENGKKMDARKKAKKREYAISEWKKSRVICVEKIG